ncbi:MAG: transporter substrate-binding domain-containing protein [Deltaproteobacteria bacterium]|nr:transporter substrate-binding domain-containing protein [Deltaproteobacteria bacterium]MBW1962742.1 transporter substrate-binding domain-containing protein [Deltaproteobacteria bacterium]MBW2150969.1 transporter substrate-binding domain-containing protein [Deltaproteobacteria bacterium]
MKKTMGIGLAVLLVLGFLAASSMADQTMDKIEKTGKIKLGFREGSIPFAFVDPKVGKHVGFSVDMAGELAKYLGMRFGKKIEIVPFTVTPKTRIPMVMNGTIDVEMGSTTYTQKREEQADFSMIFFFSETTFLVPKDSGIQKLEDLNGKRVGAARGTTNLKAVEDLARQGKFKPRDIIVTETHPQGMLALKSGKIEAYSTDRSLLEGLRMKDQNPDKWMTVPFAIAYEPYAYIMREGNSDFRDFVNNTIIWSIKTGKFFELYDKWMGPRGVVPIPLSEAYRNYLQMMVYPISDGWWKK